jgi:hypothetical protein
LDLEAGRGTPWRAWTRQPCPNPRVPRVTENSVPEGTGQAGGIVNIEGGTIEISKNSSVRGKHARRLRENTCLLTVSSAIDQLFA